MGLVVDQPTFTRSQQKILKMLLDDCRDFFSQCVLRISLTISFWSAGCVTGTRRQDRYDPKNVCRSLTAELSTRYKNRA